VQNKMLDETTCEVLLENMVHACWGLLLRRRSSKQKHLR
jgi:hypothetical protein